MQIYKAPKILIVALKRFKRKEYFSEKHTMYHFPHLVSSTIQSMDSIFQTTLSTQIFRINSKTKAESWSMILSVFPTTWAAQAAATTPLIASTLLLYSGTSQKTNGMSSTIATSLGWKTANTWFQLQDTCSSTDVEIDRGVLSDIWIIYNLHVWRQRRGHQWVRFLVQLARGLLRRRRRGSRGARGASDGSLRWVSSGIRGYGYELWAWCEPTDQGEGQDHVQYQQGKTVGIDSAHLRGHHPF